MKKITSYITEKLKIGKNFVISHAGEFFPEHLIKDESTDSCKIVNHHAVGYQTFFNMMSFRRAIMHFYDKTKYKNILISKRLNDGTINLLKLLRIRKSGYVIFELLDDNDKIDKNDAEYIQSNLLERGYSIIQKHISNSSYLMANFYPNILKDKDKEIINNCYVSYSDEFKSINIMFDCMK